MTFLPWLTRRDAISKGWFSRTEMGATLTIESASVLDAGYSNYKQVLSYGIISTLVVCNYSHWQKKEMESWHCRCNVLDGKIDRDIQSKYYATASQFFGKPVTWCILLSSISVQFIHPIHLWQQFPSSLKCLYVWVIVSIQLCTLLNQLCFPWDVQ